MPVITCTTGASWHMHMTWQNPVTQTHRRLLLLSVCWSCSVAPLAICQIIMFIGQQVSTSNTINHAELLFKQLQHMALEHLKHRFLSLTPLPAYRTGVWGWYEFFDALESTDRMLADNDPPCIWSDGQQETLSSILRFLAQCETWLNSNAKHVQWLHLLLGARNVITRLSSNCAQYLQHMHPYRHALEQLPPGASMCVVIALGTVRYAVLLLAVNTPSSTAEDTAVSMHLKMTLAVARDTGTATICVMCCP